MHILLISSVKETFAKNFLRMLLEGGHRVTHIGIGKPIFDISPQYRFIVYPFSFLPKSRFTIVNRLVDIGKYCLLHIIWRLFRPDIVHVQEIDLRAYDCVRANIHPLVLTAWGSDVNNLLVPGFWPKARSEKLVKAIASADYITADTKDIIQKCETLACHNLRASLLYFGIDFSKFCQRYGNEGNRLKESLGIPSDMKVILSVRTLKPKYGHQQIVEAFARLIADSQYNNTCLILKRHFLQPFEYEDQLRAQIDRLGLKNHVFWIDHVPDEDMPVVYAVADVVVNYPDMDAFPVTFLETAACKRPMISCDLDAYKGIFPPDTFWMVPPNDIDELSNAFKDVLSADPQEIQRRVDKVYVKAMEIGSWDYCTQDWNEFYQYIFKMGNKRAQGLY